MTYFFFKYIFFLIFKTIFFIFNFFQNGSKWFVGFWHKASLNLKIAVPLEYGLGRATCFATSRYEGQHARIEVLVELFKFILNTITDI